MAPRLPMGLCKAHTAGFGFTIVPSLVFCVKKQSMEKREMDGVLVFGGLCLMMAHNNQLRVGVGDRLEVGEEVGQVGGAVEA